MRLGEMQFQCSNAVKCHVFFMSEIIELYQVQKLGNSWLNNHLSNSCLKLWSSLDLSQVLNLTRANLCQFTISKFHTMNSKVLNWHITFCRFLWSCLICILTSPIQKSVGPKTSRTLESWQMIYVAVLRQRCSSGYWWTFGHLAYQSRSKKT